MVAILFSHTSHALLVQKCHCGQYINQDRKLLKVSAYDAFARVFYEKIIESFNLINLLIHEFFSVKMVNIIACRTKIQIDMPLCFYSFDTNFLWFRSCFFPMQTDKNHDRNRRRFH